MRVLLLGGTGLSGPFIASELVARGHEILVYHRGRHETEFLPPCEHIHGDRKDRESFAARLGELSVDAVIDLGAMCGADSEAVISSFRGRITASVHISSGDVYADLGGGEPVPEDAPLREGLPYGGAIEDYDKKEVEAVVLEACRAGDFPATVIRYPVVYGPGYRTGYREWSLIKRVLDGRTKLALPKRSFTLPLLRGYVENLAHGVCQALESEKAAGNIYNLADSQSLTMADLAKKISEILNHSWTLVPIPDDKWEGYIYSGPEGCYNLAKARSELGYDPPVAVDKALATAVRWQVAHPPDNQYPWNISNDQAAYDQEDRLIAQAGRL
jgi:nucleoside-diphosphate-sugar epimerase